MSGYAISAVLGLLLGLGLNLLADTLPRLRARPDDDEASDEAATAAEESQSPSLPRWLRLPRFWLVELVTAGVMILIWHRQGATLLGGAQLFYLALFILIAVIDIEHRLILDVVMIPAFIVAVIELLAVRRHWTQDALVGYAVGQLVSLTMYLFGLMFLRVMNISRQGQPIREVAFGFGDVTLATFCGFVLGYPDVLDMLVMMVLIGGLMAFGFLAARFVVVRRYQPNLVIPYGPAIVIAAGLILIWGPFFIRG
jgi:leader peptidase (prepilin peptidase)/N-methyltransferase